MKSEYSNEILSPTTVEWFDDAFDGLVDDDAFLDGWYAVRKIKGRHKPKDKIAKGPDENI